MTMRSGCSISAIPSLQSPRPTSSSIAWNAASRCIRSAPARCSCSRWSFRPILISESILGRCGASSVDALMVSTINHQNHPVSRTAAPLRRDRLGPCRRSRVIAMASAWQLTDRLLGDTSTRRHVFHDTVIRVRRRFTADPSRRGSAAPRGPRRSGRCRIHGARGEVRPTVVAQSSIICFAVASSMSVPSGPLATTRSTLVASLTAERSRRVVRVSRRERLPSRLC